MRALTIIVAEAAAARLRTALTLALAQVALGGTVRLFLQERAAALILPPVGDADDAAHIAAGLPTLAALLAEALDAGVAITACQSGLALIDRRADEADPRIMWGGMIGTLAATADADRLVIV
jgi:predicted peroxiredoxin